MRLSTAFILWLGTILILQALLGLMLDKIYAPLLFFGAILAYFFGFVYFVDREEKNWEKKEAKP